MSWAMKLLLFFCWQWIILFFWSIFHLCHWHIFLDQVWLPLLWLILNPMYSKLPFSCFPAINWNMNGLVTVLSNFSFLAYRKSICVMYDYISESQTHKQHLVLQHSKNGKLTDPWKKMDISRPSIQMDMLAIHWDAMDVDLIINLWKHVHIPMKMFEWPNRWTFLRKQKRCLLLTG